MFLPKMSQWGANKQVIIKCLMNEMAEKNYLCRPSSRKRQIAQFHSANFGNCWQFNFRAFKMIGLDIFRHK